MPATAEANNHPKSFRARTDYKDDHAPIRIKNMCCAHHFITVESKNPIAQADPVKKND